MASETACACDGCMVRGIGGSAYPAVSPLPEPAILRQPWADAVTDCEDCGCPACAIWPLGGSAWSEVAPAGYPWNMTVLALGGGSSSPDETANPPPDPWVEPTYPTTATVDVSMSRTVDVFLSAGPRENYGTSAFRGCSRTQMGNCSLWRVRITLPSMSVIEVEQIAAAVSVGAGSYDGVHIQPAVSPDGTRLAYSSVLQRANNSIVWSALHLLDLVTGEQSETSGDYGGTGRRQYPAWWDDDTLVYHRTDSGDAATLYQGTSWPDFTNDTGMIGPTGADKPNTAYADPNVHQNPQYKGLPIDVGPRIVTFGGPTATARHVPRVHGIKGEDPEEFVLPSGWIPGEGGDAECHHPAWRPDGTRILCTRYKSGEHIVQENRAAEVRRLFEFRWADGTWASPRPLVTMPTRAEIASIPTNGGTVTMSRDVFATVPDSNGAECQKYVWKFAEWCVENRYLVATLYCTDSVQAGDVAYDSRVVVIDLGSESGTATSADAYFDLVTAIEQDQGFALGTYSGVFSTCRAVTSSVEFPGSFGG